MVLAMAMAGFLDVFPATAAVAYRIWTEPAEPTVGEQVAIHVATYWPESPVPSGGLTPMPLPEFLWEFVADSPAGKRYPVSLQPSDGQSNQWVGRFAFDSPGEWTIGLHPRHLGTPVDPALGARMSVEVRGAGDSSNSLSPVVIAGLGTAALIAALAAFLRFLRRAG